MRLHTRIAAAAAVALMALTAPGIASAATTTDHGRGPNDDRPGSNSGSAAFWSTATPTQKAAVNTARQTYLGSAWDIKVALRKQTASIAAELATALDGPGRTLALAKDAWTFAEQTGGDTAGTKAAYDAAKAAYSAAAQAAKATAQPQYDSAKQQARSSLDTAAGAYRSTVTAAFPAGTVIPPSVLNPPGGRGIGHGEGHR
jgi:hypothetical protein